IIKFQLIIAHLEESELVVEYVIRGLNSGVLRGTLPCFMLLGLASSSTKSVLALWQEEPSETENSSSLQG
uniref:Ovule protein n=1 Tax=Romanomermis culicivorax TaxID=13658 RepID=A0A915KUK1_ROMCU